MGIKKTTGAKMTNEIVITEQPTPLAQMQRAKAIAKEIAGKKLVVVYLQAFQKFL